MTMARGFFFFDAFKAAFSDSTKTRLFPLPAGNDTLNGVISDGSDLANSPAALTWYARGTCTVPLSSLFTDVKERSFMRSSIDILRSSVPSLFHSFVIVSVGLLCGWTT